MLRSYLRAALGQIRDGEPPHDIGIDNNVKVIDQKRTRRPIGLITQLQNRFLQLQDFHIDETALTLMSAMYSRPQETKR